MTQNIPDIAPNNIKSGCFKTAPDTITIRFTPAAMRSAAFKNSFNLYHLSFLSIAGGTANKQCGSRQQKHLAS